MHWLPAGPLQVQWMTFTGCKAKLPVKASGAGDWLILNAGRFGFYR
jgi:hypothetical protein